MTEKLFYKDAYIKDFNAEIISTEKVENEFVVVLDRTAFFPEAGGQSSDKGYIGDSKVIDVYEKDGVIYHLTKTPPVGTLVKCRLDFEERFEKMQLHTAEHILCGIIHSHYGLDNVGFHLGDDVVTFDISAPLTPDELFRVETLANEVVFSNVRIDTYFPEAKDLDSLEYRSKLDLTENVRIVQIGEIDKCACCAPHVAFTAEVGIVKILDFQKHRGGLRITMTAGRRALVDYRSKYDNARKISAMLCSPTELIAEELDRYMKETVAIRSELKSAKLKMIEALANSYEVSCKNAVVLLEDASIDELRCFANICKARISGYVVALCGKEMDYKYVIMKNNGELSLTIKEINKALCGRGGGRGEMVTGSFATTIEDIKTYFK